MISVKTNESKKKKIFDREEMLNNEDDQTTLVMNSTQPMKLKSISGFNIYENHAEQRIKTTRESTNDSHRYSSINPSDEYHHEPRIRRSSIVVREHQLSQYPINYDPSPHIIRKQVDDQREQIVYKQQIAVRYLCPPTPPPPPPLIIREIRPPEPSPLPPIIIRQRPPAPVTPPPIIIRERPPTPPSYSTPQIIFKRISPVQQMSRRVIIERLPPMPAKPPNIIVERWLPYKQQKRQVIYEKALAKNEHLTRKIDSKSSNELIIQYANPSVRIEKQMSSLGIVRCDPFERTRSSSVQTIEPIYSNYSPKQIENTD